MQQKDGEFVKDREKENGTEVRFTTNDQWIVVGIHKPNNKHPGKNPVTPPAKVKQGLWT